MDINHKTYYIVGAIILIIALIWLIKLKSAQKTESLPDTQYQAAVQQTAEPAGQEEPGVWYGTLVQSDNSAQGNLLLKTADRNIYIKTSRNFSGLLNQKVKVTYEGTWQDFALGDITLEDNQ